MFSENIKKQYLFCGKLLTGPFRVILLLCFSVLCYGIHIALYPFPKRDALTYLHILHYWNATGSFSQMLEKFPKFGLLLFSFLPLKWAEKCGIPLYPASIVWMTLMSTVSVYVFYKIVLLLTGDVKKSMWCGTLLAAHPMILLYAGNLLRDTPYLMFSLLHTIFLIYAVKKRTWYFFALTGVTSAICLGCRFEAWELPVISSLFVLFYAVRKNFRKREIILWILLAAAGFFITALALLAAVTDWLLLYEKGRTIFCSFLPEWMGIK